MSDNQEIQMCELCGLRPGQTNSRFLFDSPLSNREEDPECGDWVCQECEAVMEEENADRI
jgi:hypothetical protein